MNDLSDNYCDDDDDDNDCRVIYNNDWDFDDEEES